MTDSLDRLRAALSERYVAQRELGAGGMATVYLAEDTKLHRQVAIKVLRPALAAVLGAERFLKEIDVTANLQHPNILPLHDCGEADGFLYYVMPYVEGESLRDRLHREKQLPVDDTIRLTREIADALEAAHHQGIVHRDIKPENILLSRGHAMVADFGIARAISAAGGDRLTETGVTIGTPAYMSPEQASGQDSVDARSDVYSLGCVLYEMLAGQPPFTGATAESVIQQHLTVVPAVVTGVRPSVPEHAASALHRSLAKTPADRFSTAQEFALALGQPETALAHIASRSTRSRLRGLLGAAVTAVAIGSVVLWPRANESTAPGRIMVAPFASAGDDPSMIALGELAAREITQGIDQIRIAPVIPAVVATAGYDAVRSPSTSPQITALQAARAARATYLVMGNVALVADDVRLDVEVTTLETGASLIPIDPVTAPSDSVARFLAAVRAEVLGALAVAFEQDLPATNLLSLRDPPDLGTFLSFSEGMRHRRQGDYAAAFRAFRHAGQRDSTFVLTHLWARQVARPSGLFRERALLRVRDSLLDLATRHVDLTNRYEILMVETQQAYRSGDWRRGLDLRRQRWEIAPDDTGHKEEFAFLLVGFHQATRVLELFEEHDPDATEWDRTSTGYWRYVSRAHHLLGNHRQAIAIARDGRTHFPDDPNLAVQEAQAFAAVGELDSLQNRLDDIGVLAEDPTQQWMRIGQAVMVHGSESDARPIVDRVGAWLGDDFTTKSTAAVRRYATGLIYRGDHKQAAEILEKLLQREETARDSARTLSELGTAFAGDGRAREAEAVVTVLTELGQRSASFSNCSSVVSCTAILRARIWAAMGDRDETLRLIREHMVAGGDLDGWAHADPSLRILWDDPEFQDIVQIR